MSDVITTKIPYIDGIPDQSGVQLPISWLKNEEPLNGSTSNTGNDGQLNRVSVQIQKNVSTLENNQYNITNAINQNTADIDAIKDALGTSAGSTVAGRVTVNEQNITLLQSAVSDNDTDIKNSQNDITDIKNDIGKQGPEDTIYRTVRDDLLWIKQQVGNYSGFDIDGQISDQLGSSGIKGTISSLLDSTSSQNTRLTNLEDLNQAYNISQISSDVLSIRNELGQSTDAPANGVYSTLDSINTTLSSNNADVQSIKTAIDITNSTPIATRVTTLEGSVNEIAKDLNDTNTGIIPRVVKLESELGDVSTDGSIVSRLGNLEKETTSLVSSVGTDDTSGLLKRVNYIETKIGETADDQTPPSDSIMGQLSTLNTSSYNNTSNIQNIQIELGDNTSGLIKEVNDNSTSLSNINTLVSDPKTGLTVEVNNLNTKMNGSASGKGDLDDLGVYKFVQNISNSELQDVKDSSLYVRTKGSWQKLSSSVAYMIYTGTLPTTATASDIDLSKATGQILNRSSQVSNGVQITDGGIYEVDVDLVINKAQASGTYTLTINNGSPVESASTGVITNTGTQLIKLNTVIKLSDNAQLKLTLSSTVEQTTQIDYLRLKIKPLV